MNQNEQVNLKSAVPGQETAANVTETRLAAVSIIVTDPESVESINALLHDCRDTIIGRMGIPYAKRNANVLCIVMDAPADTINALTGKLGRLNGVRVKATYNS